MRGTKPLWLLLAVALLSLWLYTDFDLLPTPYDLVLEPESETRAPGSGTAFSVGDGVWMTARHVVNGCDGIGFIKDRKLIGMADRVVHHGTADVSLLFSELSAPAFPIARPDQDPERHEEAFLIGYPQGGPRQFIAAQVEYRVIEQQGVSGAGFPIIVWAEKPQPPPGTAYAGMSGGPAISVDGVVVGVLVGADNALGRVIANIPETLRQMMAEHGIRSDAAPIASPLSGDISETGAWLRSDGRVIEVYCHVE